MGLLKIALRILCPCAAFFQGNCDQKTPPPQKTHHLQSSL